ncbi:MAG TPA: PAS domain S-box protein, partial [bacterium (Candidatus Stahlbacteria)]|nr:PAS domain S-box protein [Candidatus Stahlbacteria bacterium]
IKTKSGSYVTGEFYSTLHKKGGKVIGLLGVARDVTRYQEAKQAVIDSEARFHDLVEKAGIAILIDDREGRFTYFNDKFLEIFGYSADEMKVQSIETLVHPDDQGMVLALHKNRVEGRIVQNRYEFRGIKKGGSVVYLEVDATPIREGDTIVGTRSYIWDISDRKRVEADLATAHGNLERLVEEKTKELRQEVKERIMAEDALKKEREFLTRVTDTSLTGIVVMEPKKAQITFANARAVEILNLKKDDEAGIYLEPEWKVTQYDGSPYPNEKLAFFQVMKSKKPVYDIQYSIRFQDGKRIFLSINAAPFYNINQELKGVVATIHDVTEQIEAKHALQQSEEKYKTLTENINVGIYRNTGPEGRFIEANPAIVKIFGYDSREEFLTVNAKDLYQNPDDRKRFIEKMLTDGYVKNEVIQLKKKDDSPFYASVSAVAVRDIDGRIKYYDGIVEDITDRISAQEALKESEERYRTLTESILDAILILDFEGKVLFGNRSLAKMFGFEDPQETVGLSALDFVLDEYRETVITDLKEVFESGGRYVAEYKVRTRDGKELWVEAKGRKIVYNDTPADLVVLRDVTERKKAEEELAIQRLYFQRLFEESPEAIVMLDDQDRVMLVNKGFKKLFQYEPEEIKGKYINELVVPDNLIDEASGLSKSVLSGEVINKETVRKCKDGSLVEVSVLAYPIVVDGKLIGVYGIYTDISDRKRAEEEIKLSYEKLQKILDGTVNALASTTEKRDPYTAGHQYRTTSLACLIGRKMGLSEDKIDGIRVAGMLHDIGKIYVAAEILNKPVLLNDIEKKLIKEHCKAGYEIIKSIEFSWPVADIVYQHHERLDGSGYPQGLKGDEIMLEARILAVADVVEAMTSHRPYREALNLNDALQEIIKNRGILYDSRVVDACLELIEKEGFKFK